MFVKVLEESNAFDEVGLRVSYKASGEVGFCNRGKWVYLLCLCAFAGLEDEANTQNMRYHHLSVERESQMRATTKVCLTLPFVSK